MTEQISQQAESCILCLTVLRCSLEVLHQELHLIVDIQHSVQVHESLT